MALADGGMGLSRVRAVFFDLDNTLIDTAGASKRGMLEVTLPAPSALLQTGSERLSPVLRACVTPCSLMPTSEPPEALAAVVL